MVASPLPAGPYWMVDDEPELVNATVAMLAREVGDKQVRGSTDSRDVAQWIETSKPTALITDVRMPHLTGLDLVARLHQRWGPIPVVIITAYPTAQVDADARAGRFAFLPKPFSFQALRETLQRVCTPATAASSFSGAIAVSMLGEVVQLYGLANRTGTLRVSSPDGVGDIAFESGRVIDATSPGLRGVAAFNTILSWTSGSFGWDATPTREHTIHGGLSELLIEAYRLRDEHEAGIDSAPSTDPDEMMDLAFDQLMNDGEVSVTHEPRGNVAGQLRKLERLEGFVSVALFDLETNTTIASVAPNEAPGASGESTIDTIVRGHVELVQAKRKTLADLDLDDDIEDIVITMPDAYHLLRLGRRHKQLFFVLTLDRRHASLAMARYLLANVEQDIVL